MYSAFRRLIFLLFTLLHTKSAVGILVQDHGYIYKPPPIKSSLPFLEFPSNQFPSHIQSSSSFLPSSPQQQQQQFHYGFPQSAPTFFNNYLNSEDDLYYRVDGRLLKQYEVMEQIIGDFQHPDNFLSREPLVLDSFLAKLASQTNSPSNFFDFGGNKIQTTTSGFGNKFSQQTVTKNHGPVALGSGSLGYIRLANGGTYLGSGSLGYISGQQANQAITDAKNRKVISPPGPLHFGHGFEK